MAAMYFEVVGAIKQVEVIAAGLGVRERRRLHKAYGRGCWVSFRASLFCEARDLGAPIRAGARKARIR